MRDVIWHDSVSETKNSGKLLTIAWLASTVCSLSNSVWSVWNKPFLKSQNVNQAVNHYKSAFWYFIVIWDSLIPDSMKNTADPGAVIPDRGPLQAFMIPDPTYLFTTLSLLLILKAYFHITGPTLGS